MSFAAMAGKASQDDKRKLLEQKSRQLKALDMMKERAEAEMNQLIEDCKYTHSHYKG